MPVKNKAKRKKTGDTKPLLSHSTILILSGFLIGMLARGKVQPGYEIYVYFAGVTGLVAYLGLGYLAERRQAQAVLLADQRATANLENHFDRHIPRSQPAGSQHAGRQGRAQATSQSPAQSLTAASLDSTP